MIQPREDVRSYALSAASLLKEEGNDEATEEEETESSDPPCPRGIMRLGIVETTDKEELKQEIVKARMQEYQEYYYRGTGRGAHLLRGQPLSDEAETSGTEKELVQDDPEAIQLGFTIQNGVIVKRTKQPSESPVTDDGSLHSFSGPPNKWHHPPFDEYPNPMEALPYNAAIL
ncbi:uncharacterized protein BT62DRAFT_917185 [Guyanagaster necrorhizus]|uniref:Uncharacterized protein n=1 Tax=Guyanagaster necrorhizus TaxID=856835 RepID=A0A9P7VZN4_9AGAR|nr:uncharacterized protein BT62DRAFT_917185 [Guyanagaster necrorhizus MCA 3950]KAG7449487.1 hypothetical protein BT62DRAFT_917185 [Guyanagaster necrorhizus MCA 3950]